MLRYFKRVSQISTEENVEAKKQRIEEISIEENVKAKEASGKDATVGENGEAKEASIDDTNYQENDEVKKASIEHTDVAQLPTDPGLRTPILDYNVNLRDQIRRVYLQRGLAFCGHEESNNQGNFLEQLKFLADHNERIKAVTSKNAPKSHKLTSPKIQKDTVSAGAVETIDVIIKDIDDTFFSILVDEYQDISVNEQMSVVLRYVDKTGHVVERFIGIEHVPSTTGLSLKAAIDKLFSRYGLSISRLRGQALVAIAKKNKKVQKLFNLVSSMVNIVGASSKRCDILREKQEAIIFEALINDEISSGRGLNQQSTIARFGISIELSTALQRKDQDIVNAMSLVTVCKQRLQEMRDNEWDSFLDEVASFCQKHNIDVPDMDSVFVRPGCSWRNTEEMTNFHRFRVDLFYSVIDMQLQELNAHFSEVSTELLLCLACLCPDDSFSAFDKDKLIRLAKYYPKDFSKINFSVATASVERVFSAMNIVKNRLRNQIGDQWMNDSLVVYVEKDVFNEINNKTTIRRFQSMRSRKEQL
ncbi:uncharacterized protein LOC111411446 [Olea europaea var. sylvestris]|uniref:uncharacterized protein LOC111411446 n=1 Tax=Olea europaea var. sylvestris TaxID=158386 RepID=UPI000C1D7E66|nr:uncharacterized protein LOC111411446 [Olea europaea var. sylvestris]